MADVDEPISFVEYDPRWPRRFAGERVRLAQSIVEPEVRFEHFGSTAVPGLPGKPIIDILVGVSDLDRDADAVVPALEAHGYESFGRIFIPDRVYLRRRPAGQAFNIALCELGADFWRTQIAVREFLRAHPSEAEAYGEHKREVYEAGARLFSSYSQRKEAFVEELIERALAWVDRRARARRNR